LRSMLRIRCAHLKSKQTNCCIPLVGVVIESDIEDVTSDCQTEAKVSPFSAFQWMILWIHLNEIDSNRTPCLTRRRNPLPRFTRASWGAGPGCESFDYWQNWMVLVDQNKAIISSDGSIQKVSPSRIVSVPFALNQTFHNSKAIWSSRRFEKVTFADRIFNKMDVRDHQKTAECTFVYRHLIGSASILRR
jgi:hypothetical protein